MIKYSCKVEIKQADSFKAIASNELVPGDIIKVPENVTLPCDMILLSGSTVVNESMLTGESTSVIKAFLPDISTLIFDPKEHGKHILFGGTSVLQNRAVGGQPCLALVTNTGFMSFQGGLVRDILYPGKIRFNFTFDALKFVAVTIVMSVICTCCTIPFLVNKK